MAYTHDSKGKTYTLYTRKVELKGGREQQIFFFSSGTPKSGTAIDLPPGYRVVENPRTGLPFLKKK